MVLLVGIQTQSNEIMILLDEKISAVKISDSNGFDGMND